MIIVNGYAAECIKKGIFSITINGAWIDVRVSGKSENLRNPDNGPWYDPNHARVMKAVGELEQALINLVAGTSP